MQESWCFHLSLNVASLPRAIDFYRVLFGMEPAKCHDDYAKFEVIDPPLVFSLVPHAAGSEATRSQVGLRLSNAENLHQIRSRLIARGIAVKSSECGKSAYRIVDPDGNAWQISVDDDLPDQLPTSAPVIEQATRTPGTPVVWEHSVTAALPVRIPHDDATLDEVRLTGSFNGPHQLSDRQRFIEEVVRVLKPGGKVVVHALAADKPFVNGMPALPGLASMVSRVPTHDEIAAELKQAGFAYLQFTKFGEKAWFEHDGIEMREIKALGWKTVAMTEPLTRDVIYRGPFRQIRDDLGNTYPRGKRVAVASSIWCMLRQSPQAGLFVFVEGEKAATACQVETDLKTKEMIREKARVLS